MFKKILLVVVLILVGSFVLSRLWANFLYKNQAVEKPVDLGPPVATVEYLEPNKNYHNGSIRKVTYPYGTITISRDYIGQFNIDHDSLFLEVNTHWPDFEKGHEFAGKSPMQYLRIMLKIRRKFPKPITYSLERSYKEMESVALDRQYKGLVGYRKRSGWQYETLRLKNLEGEPIVISCTEDNDSGVNPDYRRGSCRYYLNFDKDLYAEIRFNKPLMSDFIQVHKDLMEFIDTIRESN